MKSPSVRRVLIAWIVAIVAVFVVATSDDDPEGLAVGPQHLEQVLELEQQQAQKAE